jgi:putative transposase
MIDSKHKLSIRKQCKLLGIHRSGLYYTNQGEGEENLRIMRLMDEYHLNYPTAGVLQIQDYLRGVGLVVNHKRIRRLLRKMGIMAQYPRRTLSNLGEVRYIRPYLLKNLKIERANEVWQIDITYIPMAKGFMYLVAIIDVYSRFVVGWSVSNSMSSDWVCQVCSEAIGRYGKPEIINSDQGSQFTSQKWIELLEGRRIRVSMDGKGRAIDNVYIERLWRTVKYDHVYLHPAEDGWELVQGLKAFFQRYNFERTHQGIGRKTPATLYTRRLVA